MPAYFSKYPTRSVLICLAFLAGTILAACSSPPYQPVFDGWLHDEVLALDPIDAPQPDQDLIALYHRKNGSDFQFRVDYLDLDVEPSHDLYIALDTGEFNTIDETEAVQAEVLGDLMLVFPAEGTPRALDSEMQIRDDLFPRIVRDPTLDAAVISLTRSAVPELSAPFRVMVTTTAPAETLLVDGIDPVSSDAPPPPPAPLLLAFWNSFPAYSPAQALRRWQGAHTGPFGGRHGLRTIIEAVDTYDIPVTLLDLKNPKSLSALDFIGPWEEIKSLSGGDLLGLPDSVPVTHLAVADHLPFDPPDEALLQGIRKSRDIARSMALPNSPALYAPLVPETIPSRYDLVLMPPTPLSFEGIDEVDPAPPTAVDLVLFDGKNYLIFPEPGEDLQAYPDGLGMPAKVALLETAFSEASWSRGGPRLVVLGGDLPLSSWGDPEFGEATFHYISAHPWIDALTLDDLASQAAGQAVEIQGDGPLFPPLKVADPVPYGLSGGRQISGLTISEMHADFYNRLLEAPGRVQDLAWDAYFSYLDPSPPEPGLLQTLRQGYFGQLGSLLAVTSWLADPGPLSDCESDPDLDGEPECILASDELLFIIEPRGARLTHAFVLENNEITQWIAPYSQFIQGRSDPTSWQLELGPGADPGDVPGAFSDRSDLWLHYRPTVLSGGLRFNSEDGTRRKTFKITPSGLQVVYEFPDADLIQTQIPLALAPQSRFSPGWQPRYQAGETSNSLVWSVEDGPRINIQTNGNAALHPFFADERQKEGPEDPNYDYPPGHFNPFPFALVEVSGPNGLEIEISLSD